MSAAEAEEAKDAAGKESVKDHLSCNLRVRVDFLVSITFDRAKFLESIGMRGI